MIFINNVTGGIESLLNTTFSGPDWLVKPNDSQSCNPFLNSIIN